MGGLGLGGRLLVVWFLWCRLALCGWVFGWVLVWGCFEFGVVGFDGLFGLGRWVGWVYCFVVIVVFIWVTVLGWFGWAVGGGFCWFWVLFVLWFRLVVLIWIIGYGFVMGLVLLINVVWWGLLFCFLICGLLLVVVIVLLVGGC